MPELRVTPADLYIAVGKLYIEKEKVREYGEELERTIASQAQKIVELEPSEENTDASAPSE